MDDGPSPRPLPRGRGRGRGFRGRHRRRGRGNSSNSNDNQSYERYPSKSPENTGDESERAPSSGAGRRVARSFRGRQFRGGRGRGAMRGRFSEEDSGRKFVAGMPQSGSESESSGFKVVPAAPSSIAPADLIAAPDAPNCSLCNFPIVHYAILSCGESGSMCARCVVKLAKFQPKEEKGKPLKCPYCQSYWKEGIIFSNENKSFSECLPLKKSLYNTQLRIYSDSIDVHQRFLRATAIFCKPCEKIGKQTRFKSLRQLSQHLEKKHKLFHCMACMTARKQSVEDAQLYTKTALLKHFKHGSPAMGNDPPVAPHPFCQFCRDPYFSKDELFAHMESNHLTCAICNRRSEDERVYFRHHKALRQHYDEAERHFVCKEPSCMQLNHDVVFDNEIDFKQHNLAYHIDTTKMSRAERKRATRLNFGVFAGSSTAGRGGGRGGRTSFRQKTRFSRDIAYLSLADDDHNEEKNPNNTEEVARAREAMRAELEKRYKVATAKLRAATPPSQNRRNYDKDGDKTKGSSSSSSSSLAGEGGIGRSHSIPTRLSAAAVVGGGGGGNSRGALSEFPTLGGGAGGQQRPQNKVYPGAPPEASVENFPAFPSSQQQQAQSKQRRANNRSNRNERRARKRQDSSNHSSSSSSGSVSVGDGKIEPCPPELKKQRHQYFKERLLRSLGGDKAAMTQIRRALSDFVGKGLLSARAFLDLYFESCDDTIPLKDIISLILAEKPERGRALLSTFRVVMSEWERGGGGVATTTSSIPPAAVAAEGGGVWSGKHDINPYRVEVLYNPMKEKKKDDQKHKNKNKKKNTENRNGGGGGGGGWGAGATNAIASSSPSPSLASSSSSSLQRSATLTSTNTAKTKGRSRGKRDFPTLGGGGGGGSSSSGGGGSSGLGEGIPRDSKAADRVAAEDDKSWRREGMVDAAVLQSQISDVCASPDCGLQLMILCTIHGLCEEFMMYKGVTTSSGIAQQVPSGKRDGLADLAKRPNFKKKNPNLILAIGNLRSLGFKESSHQYISQVSRMASAEDGCGSRVANWVRTSLGSFSTTDVVLLHQFVQMLLLRAFLARDKLANVVNEPKSAGTYTVGTNAETDSAYGGGGKKKKKKKKKKRILLL